MISMLSETAYAITYKWLIVTLVISFIVSQMVSFPWKCTLLLPPEFNFKFESVSFSLHFPNFVRGQPEQRDNFLCKKFFLKLSR